MFEEQTLILAPHLDDEVLGCFSFLGPNAFVLWFGVEDFHGVDRETRLQEARAVAAATGFSYDLLSEPVNRYRTDQLIAPIEQRIHELRPRALLLPRPSYNQDHRSVYEAGFTAARPHDTLPMTPRVLVYDQVHANLWPRDQFDPNYFRGIEIGRKLEVWRLHRSQNRGHRCEDHLETLARMRGQQAGLTYAEAFQVLRWVEP